MAWTQKHGRYWRGCWRGPNGKIERSPAPLRFTKEKDAENYVRDQEAAIRNNTYEDPRTGSITVTEWANVWFPALDLELSTLDNYRYQIEVNILPTFGGAELRDLTTEDIATWEKNLTLTRRTAREARGVLTNMLNDAIPRHIKVNPAARRRGKGRKGSVGSKRPSGRGRSGRRRSKRS